MKHKLVDDAKSPLDNLYDEELRECVESELKSLAEPYRTTVILRDIEELSYEQIAEVLEISLGTVKSRLVRGRDTLRKKLQRRLPAFGESVPEVHQRKHRRGSALSGQEFEVAP